MKITVKSKFHNYKVRIEDDYACFRGVALSTLKGKKICVYSDANFNADEIMSALKGYEVYPLNSAGGERTSNRRLRLPNFCINTTLRAATRSSPWAAAL